jgi:hypothetical protein
LIRNIVTNTPYSNTAETLGVQQLICAFSGVFPGMRVLRNLILPMPEDSPIRTGEFDVVLVTGGGVFAFEIKGWRDGVVYREKQPDGRCHWFVRPNQGGEPIEVPDPVQQGGRKIAFLRSVLPPRLRTTYHVLLPMSGVELDPMLPVHAVCSTDLAHLARSLRAATRHSQSWAWLDDDAIELTVHHLLALQGDLRMEQHVCNCVAARMRFLADAEHTGGTHGEACDTAATRGLACEAAQDETREGQLRCLGAGESSTIEAPAA